MNIDNSIGMALFSGELSGAAAIGSQQGSAASMAESPQGSLFQQLISQMLTAQNKSGGTGEVISGLFPTGGNLPKLGLMKEDIITGEAEAEMKGSSGKKQETGENAAVTDMLQALMAGMTNTAAAANVEKAFMGFQTGKPEESQPAAIGGVGTVSGNPAVTVIPEKTANNPVLQFSFNETNVPTVGKTELTETAEAMTAGQPSIQKNPEDPKKTMLTGFHLESRGKAETASGIEFQVSEKAVTKSDEADKPNTIAPQGLLTPKAENGNQAAVPETLTSERAAPHADKAKQDNAAADGTDTDAAGLQNSVQGAVATGEISENTTVNRTNESPQPYSQIREEILTRLEQNGPTEFKMQLEPEDLGQIDIKLKLSEGKLVIDILAADSRTQALLTNQVDKLISSMGLQNVQVESVQVGQQMNSQTQDNSLSQGFTMNSAMDFSQRRHQEQSRQEIFNNGKPSGTFSSQQDDAQTNDTRSRIDLIRFNSYRMNYSV